MESARQKTKPREVGLYDMFCGLLYVPKEGHKWRAAHEYFLTWSEKAACGQPSVLGVALKNQVGAVRCRKGRQAKANFLVIDAQSVGNTDTAKQKGLGWWQESIGH